MWDAFPDETKWRYVNQWVMPGAIIRMSCVFVDKSNDTKYMVIAAVEPFLVFIVNTKARYNPDVSTQVELKKTDYPDAIDVNCFINANSVLDGIAINFVQENIKKDRKCYRGRLLVNEIKSVIHAMAKASDIAPRYQKAIVAALTPLISHGESI